MGSTKWIIGSLLLFTILTVFSNIIEATYYTDSNVITLWTAITAFSTIDMSNPLTAIWGILVNLGQLVQAIWNSFIWDYSFFSGEWAMVRWVICIPISAGIAIGLIFEMASVFRMN